MLELIIERRERPGRLEPIIEGRERAERWKMEKWTVQFDSKTRSSMTNSLEPSASSPPHVALPLSALLSSIVLTCHFCVAQVQCHEAGEVGNVGHPSLSGCGS